MTGSENEDARFEEDRVDGGRRRDSQRLAAAVAAGLDAGEHVLWYRSPAREWLEALPVGNGRLAAMVYGGVKQERLQLNEGTLWAGGPHDYTHSGAAAALPEIRRLVFAGEWEQAQQLVSERFMSEPLRQMPYQTVGSLVLEMSGAGDETSAQEYRRDLDIDSAIASCDFMHSGVRYRREVFVSAPHKVIVVRLTADRQGGISFTARFETPRGQSTVNRDRDSLTLTGEGGAAEGIPGAVRFTTIAQLLNQDMVQFYNVQQVAHCHIYVYSSTSDFSIAEMVREARPDVCEPHREAFPLPVSEP